ncbi:hypothetical protein A6A04_12165 [Paramagnetospirillum marisnigri]|uniref:protein O-GlcNAc transferase n=1 Tax=Paramagnetospirillum marisnigri TaxID=1285242 RepID=A0A178MY40_9PROT|nr:tetratricopeptide repeat protein [Paramagnetospirillum marisnigri]OAN54672.1 hypothetical protein A6A04_12165 [Paramagnetospirillum marisnigri]
MTPKFDSNAMVNNDLEPGMTDHPSLDTFQTALDLQVAGQSAAAIQAYDKVIAEQPDHHRACYNRGIALAEGGRLADAMVSYALAAASRPDYPDAYVNLAALCDGLELYDKSLETLRLGALRCRPHAALHNNLGQALAGRGKLQEAMNAFSVALSAAPDLVPALMGLGKAAFELGQHTIAFEAFRKAEQTGGGADAINGIGAVLRATGRTAEAADEFRRAVECDPGNPDSHNNLGLTLRQQGRFGDAIDCFRSSLRLRPTSTAVHDNYLFCLQYDPTITPSDMAIESAEWVCHTREIVPLPPPKNIWQPHRRLRIGYVSPDFRQHACMYFLEPLIQAHDRRGFEIFCYAEVAVEDDLTRQLASTVDGWTNTYGMNDAQLAARIRADGVDILVDLAGHTGGNRLMAFAYRPAPIQLATLIGYAATTGLNVFDAILGDPYLTPQGSEAHFTEPVLRLPRIIAPFKPRADWPAPPPLELGAGFACVADPARIDGRTLALWEQILEGVPDTRLLLKHALFTDPAATCEWRSRLGKLSDRIDLEGIPGGWSRHMESYGRMAVVLDTPMHSGGTTVAIPLWMGVPVVTLAGPNSWQRFGATLVANAGLPDLVALDDTDYIAKAVMLMRDKALLQDLRANLRSRMAASPLCDATLHADDLSRTYRSLWCDACSDHA